MKNNIIHGILLLLILLLTILHIDVRIRLLKLDTELKTRVTFKVAKQRAEYVDISLHDLEYEIHGIRSIANTAYDATTDFMRYDWIEGLTTSQIDSILIIGGDKNMHSHNVNVIGKCYWRYVKNISYRDGYA